MSGSSERGRILIVDDDPIALRITRARLEDAGFDVVTRDQALGTSQAVVDERPDVVILDIKMPALTGDMLAEVIQRNPNATGVPIIFHSSERAAILQRKVEAQRVLGFIIKTDDDQAFISQFERLFAQSKLRAQREQP